ncbi:Zeta_toxin domain-containing protein [Pseudomonas sp. OF001]|uniref:zeta toxin family protein n=1 Tax=Pseudomonas sp. OF001 TaxID=2772300 RepID=UPI00191A1009|nr:zeta toxin family protein [Pseudomonas sp. OF001]CAD5376741.1 Zeta_toxin domain-containing protein [Pseudomonas sp. OF001]
MTLSPEEQRIIDAAMGFARANKKAIARRFTDRTIYLPEDDPVSVFMAGSPGAGKTEASIALLKQFGVPVLRIDPDELRSEFAEYSGGNAWLFQGAVSILVEKIIDFAIKQHQSFLLDGTLTNIRIARSNIERSLGRGRVVQILYVYQEPLLAWRFVQAREASEGRRIRPEHFVEQYFAARDVVNQLKLEFGKQIHVDLLVKNNDNSARSYKAGIDQIDYHVPEKHTRAALERKLGILQG